MNASQSLPTPITVRRSFLVLLIALGIGLTVLRMVSVAVWTVGYGHDIHSNLLLEIALAVVGDLILACLVGIVLLRTRGQRVGFTYENAVSSLTYYSVASLLFLVVSAILPDTSPDHKLATVYDVIVIHFVALGSFVIAIGLAAFLATVLLSRWSLASRIQLIVLTVIISVLWMGSAIDLASVWWTVSKIVLLVTGAVLVMRTGGRFAWLSSTTMDRKVRLLWITMCALFASLVLAVMHLWQADSLMLISANEFIRSASVVPGAIHLFGVFFFLRFLVAIIGSLPNSGIVDRRASEVASLAFIMRKLSEAEEVEEVLQLVTEETLRICQAHGAWYEEYDGDTTRVVATQIVHRSYVESLHSIPQFHQAIASCEIATFMPAIRQRHPALGHLEIRSLLVIPIRNGGQKRGTLVAYSALDYGFVDEDLKLLTAYADMVSVSLDQARLLADTIRRERLQREADVARKIQSSLLPQGSPVIQGFSVHSVMIPATEVGGDYFDYLQFNDESLGVLIADVAGKGIPASLYMATLKGVVLSEMRRSSGPADLLRRINKTMHGSMSKKDYITISCLQLVANNHSVRLARAGHTPTLMKKGNGFEILRPPGVAIGLVPPNEFDEVITELTLELSAGDLLLLTTDGVTERRNHSHEEIGLDAVGEWLSRLSPKTGADLVGSTLQYATDHAVGETPHDDITIIGIVATPLESAVLS